jgi:hypothetical protein
MRYEKACIPLGGAWSSPFVCGQGPPAQTSSLDLAGDAAEAVVLRIED